MSLFDDIIKKNIYWNLVCLFPITPTDAVILRCFRKKQSPCSLQYTVVITAEISVKNIHNCAPIIAVKK